MMEEPHMGPAQVAFDRYVLDPGRRKLLRNGKPVVLQGRAFDLLSILVASRGVPISREVLYKRLWPNGIVEDGNLTQNIYLLRRTLDPTGTGRTFIETLPRYGYRFSKPVQECREQTPGALAVLRKSLLGGALAATVAALSFSGSTVKPADVPLNREAAVAYSLGLYHLKLRTVGDLKYSVAYFAQTVREAPQSALGYAGLASAYGLEAEFEKDGSAAFVNDVDLAKHNRDLALASDGANAEAHAVAAFLAYRFDSDPVLAEREFQAALATDPRNADAHQWHAILLFSQGSIKPALTELELAHQLDPTSEVISRWLGRAYVYQHRPDDAIRTLSDTLTIEPADAPAWLTLASAQEERGHLRDALQTLESVRRRMPYENAYVIPDEARVRVLLNHGAGDRRTIGKIDRLVADKRLDAVEASLFYIALGSRDRAIAVLQGSRPTTPIAASMEKSDPRFEPIRTDPRFQRLFD